ncbi:MAG: ATP-binding protein [Chitinophagales bacterium]
MKSVFVCFLLGLALPCYAQQSQLDSLRMELIKAKDDSSKVLIMTELEEKFRFHNSDSAISYAQRALALAQKSKFLYGQYLAYINLFFPYNIVGDYTKTLQAMVAALKIAEQLPNRREEALIQAHMFMGFVYREMGDFKAAIAQHLMVVEILRQAGIPPTNYASVYSNIANAYMSLKMLDSAAYWEDATSDIVKKSKGPKSRGGHGRYEEALEHYVLAEKYYRETIQTYFLKSQDDNKYFLTGYYNDLARVLLKTKKYDSSIAIALLAYDISVKNNYLHYELMAAKTLSQVYEAKKQPDSIIKYLNRINLTNDTIFNLDRLRQFQDIGVTEEQRQKEILAAQEKYKNQVKFYGMLAASVIFLLIAFILFRNNRQKQKANTKLNQQRTEIETALTSLKTTQKQLVQSEKMASLGELTAGIAHEIQNPLNFVNNFSDVNGELIDELQQQLNAGNNEEAISISNNIKENEKKINHHGRRADAIVKGMLQHSRTNAGLKLATDINALADEYLRLSFHGFRAKDQRDPADRSFNTAIHTSFDDHIGKIKIIPQDIGRVLLNLYNNAFYSVTEKKKKNENGLPAFAKAPAGRPAGESAAYEPIVFVSTKKLPDKVEIRVRDNGMGIPQNIIDKIYQPFFTTKPTGEGTGLGLSLSYDIITKMHGGELTVDTKVDEYAEFIIRLPIQ